VIAGTSAWVEFLRGTDSFAHRRLAAALRAHEPVWVTDVIFQEVLQGARDAAHFLRLERALGRLPCFRPASTRDLSRDAALLYARCRRQEVTIRNPNDCLIAMAALMSGLPLLAHDRDFFAIVKIEPRLQLLVP
jgi:predicted nucleic acid-binding protein